MCPLSNVSVFQSVDKRSFLVGFHNLPKNTWILIFQSLRLVIFQF